MTTETMRYPKKESGSWCPSIHLICFLFGSRRTWESLGAKMSHPRSRILSGDHRMPRRILPNHIPNIRHCTCVGLMPELLTPTRVRCSATWGWLSPASLDAVWAFAVQSMCDLTISRRWEAPRRFARNLTNKKGQTMDKPRDMSGSRQGQHPKATYRGGLKSSRCLYPPPHYQVLTNSWTLTPCLTHSNRLQALKIIYCPFPLVRRSHRYLPHNKDLNSESVTCQNKRCGGVHPALRTIVVSKMLSVCGRYKPVP